MKTTCSCCAKSASHETFRLRTRVSDDARAGSGAGWNTRGGGCAA
ncbi:MAG: hypothetical protein QF681_06525 [Vicinamibacterales bacterium]|nr:hypothetical protein [Vicinamibacterales bacterium]